MICERLHRNWQIVKVYNFELSRQDATWHRHSNSTEEDSHFDFIEDFLIKMRKVFEIQRSWRWVWDQISPGCSCCYWLRPWWSKRHFRTRIVPNNAFACGNPEKKQRNASTGIFEILILKIFFVKIHKTRKNKQFEINATAFSNWLLWVRSPWRSNVMNFIWGHAFTILVSEYG